MIDWIKNLFKDTGYHSDECSGDSHYGKIKTPTLSRTVISVDAPCQCGFYTSHKDFMDKQFEKLEKTLKDLQDNNTRS